LNRLLVQPGQLLGFKPRFAGGKFKLGGVLFLHRFVTFGPERGQLGRMGALRLG
jgi:hypothetical protein